MEVIKEESKASIEHQFLFEAQTGGVKVLVGQMNKIEHQGTILDIGRYEINIEENGRIVTILKQEISYLSAPHPLLTAPPVSIELNKTEEATDSAQGRPNIQQEFLDKAIRENQQLTFFLISGQRIRATIDAYDSFTILLKENGNQHLYYKHSITTINR